MVVIVGLLVDVLDIASLRNRGSMDWGLLNNLDLIVVWVHMGLDPVVVIGALVEVLLSMGVLYPLEMAYLVMGMGGFVVGSDWLVVGMDGSVVSSDWLVVGGVHWCVVGGVHWLVMGGVHWLMVSSKGVDVGGHFCWLDFYKII